MRDLNLKFLSVDLAAAYIAELSVIAAFSFTIDDLLVEIGVFELRQYLPVKRGYQKIVAVLQTLCVCYYDQ